MCGCNRKAAPSRGVAVRPNISFRANVGGVAVGATPAQFRAVGMQAATSMTEARQMDTQRRRIEKLRRDAIRAALGR